MVFFVCSKCNASLRKKQVHQHFLTCRPVDVSCVDCSKSFNQQSYSAHTTCISEKEKYDSANFKHAVPKGAAKQDNWTSAVHSKLRTYNAPSGVPTLMKKKLLESTNIPRKKAKFENFLSTSFRFAKQHDIDALWKCISQQDNVEISNSIAKESNDSTKSETFNCTNGSVSQKDDNDFGSVDPDPKDSGNPNEEYKKIHKRFRKIIKSVLNLRAKPLKAKKLRKMAIADFKASKHYDKTIHSDKFLESLLGAVLENSRRFVLSEDKQKKLRQTEEKPKRKALPSIVIQGVDPSSLWTNLSELGDGAFGKVYKASNNKTGQLAALKSVDFTSEEELEDLMVEIDILNDCKHPNILQLHEAYVFNKRILMYLEYCGGGAVDDIMKNLDKPLTEQQIKFISREVISGLAFLHQHLIIHRDLKAGNILITSNYEIRLADFGVSAQMGSECQKRTTFIGTPYWMAPEVIACETFKDNPYDVSADVWSFGIMLIEFAQMLPPYNELNPTRVLLKITKSDPPTLAKPSNWSDFFNKIIRRCLQKNPSQRATMNELMSDPFVANVTEADRSVIKLLLGEANAEVVEVVQDITPDDLPDFDTVLVSAETVEAMAHSLQEIDSANSADDKSSSTDTTQVHIVSYEDVPFEDGPKIPPLFITESEEQSEKENCSLQTSFGVVAPPSEPSMHPSKQLSTSPPAPMLLPEFALEISRTSDVDSLESHETREITLPHPFDETATSNEGEEVKNSNPLSSEQSMTSVLQQCPKHFRASIRTRRFVVDGKEHTTTSKRVVLAETKPKPIANSGARLRALREFRELAKESKRRNREIAGRMEQQMRQLDSKQANEFTQLHRGLTRDLEAVVKKYKSTRDRLELQYENDLKALREANVQAEKTFLDQFKLQLERNVPSRTLRKSIFRNVRESIDSGRGISSLRALANDGSSVQASEYYWEAAKFLEREESNLASQVNKLKEVHKKKIAHLDLQLQSEQYELNMNFTKEQGKMEQRHMHMRHQLARSQLKDFAMADRQLLAKRLASQLIELKDAAEADKERLQETQMLERKIYLKNEKSSHKRRMAHYQKKLRDHGPPSGMTIKEAIAKMDETERLRSTDAIQRLENHHQMQWQALDREIMSRFIELDEQQSEKKTLLSNQETNRLKELEDENKQEMKAHIDRLQRKLQQLRERYEKEIINRADTTSFDSDMCTNPDYQNSNSTSLHLNSTVSVSPGSQPYKC
nr:STE20 serine:threonine protein kinase [Hymenolepis microstoma]